MDFFSVPFGMHIILHHHFYLFLVSIVYFEIQKQYVHHHYNYNVIARFYIVKSWQSHKFYYYYVMLELNFLKEYNNFRKL